jgi:hypothetical protein
MNNDLVANSVSAGSPKWQKSCALSGVSVIGTPPVAVSTLVSKHNIGVVAGGPNLLIRRHEDIAEPWQGFPSYRAAEGYGQDKLRIRAGFADFLLGLADNPDGTVKWAVKLLWGEEAKLGLGRAGKAKQEGNG